MNAQQSELFDLLDGFEMTKSQHDWLERRFENLTVKESLLFRGAMQIERPQMTADVMLIALCKKSVSNSKLFISGSK